MAMRREGEWLEAEFIRPLPKDATGLEGVNPEDLSMVHFDGETADHITYARPLESKPSGPGRWWARVRGRPGE